LKKINYNSNSYINNLKKKINIGIIGLGVGLKYLKTLTKNDKVGNISVFDFNKKKLKFVITKYKKVKICTNFNEILQDKSINLVCIATYDSYHFAQTLKSLENTKHVFVEKPICLKFSELKILFEKYKNNNLFLSTNFNLRSSKTFQNLRKFFLKNKKNQIYYTEGDYNSGRTEKIISGWRSKEKYHSIVLSSSIHLIDLISWIFGEYPTEVTGFANKIITKNTNFKYDDFVVGIFKFKKNILCKITANIGCVSPHFHKLTIYSKNNTFEQNLLGSISITKSNKNKFKIKKIQYDYRKRNKNDNLDKFIDNLRLNKKINLKKESNNIFKIMSICFAFNDSIKKKKTIKINYL